MLKIRGLVVRGCPVNFAASRVHKSVLSGWHSVSFSFALKCLDGALMARAIHKYWKKVLEAYQVYCGFHKQATGLRRTFFETSKLSMKKYFPDFFRKIDFFEKKITFSYVFYKGMKKCSSDRKFRPIFFSKTFFLQQLRIMNFTENQKLSKSVHGARR